MKDEIIETRLILEMHGCAQSILQEKNQIKDCLHNLVTIANLNTIGNLFYKFQKNGGISGVVLISESHLSIHTWPEKNYLSFDMFTCGKSLDPTLIYENLIQFFSPAKIKMTLINNGIITQKDFVLTRKKL